MKLNIWALIALFGIGAVSLQSCKKDDDDDSMEPETNTFTAMDQTLSQNMVHIDEVEVANDSWIVVHKDDGSGTAPMVPDIISEPKMVSAGTSNDVMIQLDTSVTLVDGEQLWIMLHNDDGIIGTYEFDGANGLDEPILDANGNIVMNSINVTSASITAADQAISSNTVTINNVYAAVDGWLVIHNDDGSGGITLPGIVGKTQVNAGSNANVVVELDTSVTYTPGQKLFPMLHIDAGIDGTYEFPGVDLPEIFGNDANNIIVVDFTVM